MKILWKISNSCTQKVLTAGQSPCVKDNLPEEPERIDVWLNRIEKITTIGSNMTTIQNSQLT